MGATFTADTAFIKSWIQANPDSTFKAFNRAYPKSTYSGRFSYIKNALKKSGRINPIDNRKAKAGQGKKATKFRQFDNEVAELRDYYAGLAMQIIMMDDTSRPKLTALNAYAHADALIEAREGIK